MELPYHEQETNYTCGVASLRMVLEYVGIKKSEKQLARLLHTNKVRGTWPRYFPDLAEKYQLNYVVKHKGSLKELKHLVRKGYVIIVCYFWKKSNSDHYSVVKKIDKTHIYLYDPSPSFGPVEKMSIIQFDRIWKTDPRFKRKERRWMFGMKKE